MRFSALSVLAESATASRCLINAHLRQAGFIRPIALISRGDFLSRDPDLIPNQTRIDPFYLGSNKGDGGQFDVLTSVPLMVVHKQNVPASPNLQAHVERVIKTLKHESASPGSALESASPGSDLVSRLRRGQTLFSVFTLVAAFISLALFSQLRIAWAAARRGG